MHIHAKTIKRNHDLASDIRIPPTHSPSLTVLITTPQFGLVLELGGKLLPGSEQEFHLNS